ncbi:tRNA nucleotidyltransferase (CCA-adding enzyme) [Ereboglobus sp. PH5-5]|uniref:CCA tRNA nucleotidyltransferase n=1 Tax=Ereboglobus sp. PH5-5 TaxID=2940529 RepID=UPI00240727A7|nr:polynucleotide adenylyltransferase [Ereboglobus sp. PH5-5]MDF9832368.1 tRNA nucleotidyltransferase (CCA-adding enzyme) [Ereboglobus sp. PH5-5]
MMRIPQKLLAVMQALRAVGRPRLVGGCVRDWLLGIEPKDFDIEVPGATFEQMHAILAPFGSTDIVGRSFGVIKLRIDGVEYDFSLPRRESKTGAGHRGFAVAPEPNLSDADAAARRDFTVNAIAYDPFAAAEKNDPRAGLIDPHHGERDLRARVLRHTSAAFTEDPLRVLRAFQLAARFDFTLAPETVALCRAIAPAFAELPVERIWGEWQKWAEKSGKPSRGLEVLEQTGWLAHFPELAALRGTPQDPGWHPEGDVFTHTAHCCDALARLDDWRAAAPPRRRALLLAVLAHDFGKPSTTQYAERRGKLRWISPGHEAAGGPPAETFLQRIGAPRETIDRIVPLVLNHLAHHNGQSGNGAIFSDTAVRRLARRLLPATIDDLCLVMRADHDGRPPKHSPETLDLIELLRETAHRLEIADSAPRPILQGRHLIAAGMAPGKQFKSILTSAFEAQLEGAFTDEAGALEWLGAHLNPK